MKLYKIDKYCITYINITYRINVIEIIYLSEKYVQLKINFPLVEKTISFYERKKKKKKRFKKKYFKSPSATLFFIRKKKKKKN